MRVAVHLPRKLLETPLSETPLTVHLPRKLLEGHFLRPPLAVHFSRKLLEDTKIAIFDDCPKNILFRSGGHLKRV